jgi:RND family efflux transporter MFP subunit
MELKGCRPMQKFDLLRRRTLAIAVLAGLSLGGLSASVSLADDSVTVTNQFPAHTAPVEKRELNFDVPGVVDKVLVKEGDTVKAGQLIAEQDTAVDDAHLKAAELVANSSLEIDAEQAQLEKDTVDRTRKTELIKTQSIAPSELEEAQLAVKIDQFKLDHAKEDKQKAGYDVLESKAKIKDKQMYATVDGVVSQIATHEGELADTQHPAITIVKNDVLYVEVDLPADVVRRLKASGMKAPLQVRYVDEGEQGVWRDASVHFIKPEADAQSNFEHVQLQMPNVEMRSAGLQVTVKLPNNLIGPSAGGAAARVTDSR